jgi:hypothetical protein
MTTILSNSSDMVVVRGERINSNQSILHFSVPDYRIKGLKTHGIPGLLSVSHPNSTHCKIANRESRTFERLL